ncbi:uncharacterized protein LOC119681435 [Teleopsis dalmanni]|uniref:uncharacterized protein LOC119681435 n=1 Tax=Teleopsis dalmanni TaxID=139649 RepID=UPI0018CF5B50|nr:uncharacterized protein LOC119681435 [Teleopsis dalmanni]
MREPFCRARVYVTTILIAEVLLGILIVALTLIYHRILGGYLGEKECKLLTGQLFNTYLLGTQLIITYFFSIFMWRRLWKRKYTPNVELLLHLWIFFTFLIVFCGFGSIYSLFSCADSLENLAETSLLKGIDLYYTCPEWKLMWDSLQYYKECCGVHSYKDWMKASWMPQELQTSDQGSCSGISKDTILAPYACCKHDCSTCYQNYVPHPGSGGEIPALSIGQINTYGCLPIFANNMWRILYTLLGLMIVAFKLDIILCCMTKYIIRNQCMDDCDGPDNYADDDQNLVVVKCPPNVRCLLLDEVDGNSNKCCGNNIPEIKVIDSEQQCQFCLEEQRRCN